MLNQTLNFPEAMQNGNDAYLIPADGSPPTLVEGILTIGRHQDSDLRLLDRHVSLRHCQIERRPHGTFIRDLQSRNGVMVNGLRVSEGQIINETQIQIGSTHFVFRTERPKSTDDLPLKSKNEDWLARLRTIRQLSQTDLPVFLQGESGTGKEVIAHLIHDQSPRGENPFVSVNCSALTETLVESELFGHVKGSFTGATGDRRGAFDAARGGTLFLDEIGDLPLPLQPKLLRAIENKEIKPVGSDRTISTNVRIISATHKNLEQMVTEQKFRADLFFRIHVIKIPIPALRQRMEDFDDLLYHFCREMRVRFSVLAIESLKHHSWPGNIRELRNVVARAHALFPQTYVQPEHLRQILELGINPHTWVHSPKEDRRPKLPFLKDIERDLIKSRLLANQGNQRRTAAELGMPKSTLHDRIKTYNIEYRSLVELEGLKEDPLGPTPIEDLVKSGPEANL